MSRRVSLPGASELFRRTESGELVPAGADGTEPVDTAGHQNPAAQNSASKALASKDRATAGAQASIADPEDRQRPSGRVRHDEKITVYLSSDELLALEQARLVLRGKHRISADRGRIVRAALSLALADLDNHGPQSALAQSLRTDDE